MSKAFVSFVENCSIRAKYFDLILKLFIVLSDGWTFRLMKIVLLRQKTLNVYSKYWIEWRLKISQKALVSFIQLYVLGQKTLTEYFNFFEEISKVLISFNENCSIRAKVILRIFNFLCKVKSEEMKPDPWRPSGERDLEGAEPIFRR